MGFAGGAGPRRARPGTGRKSPGCFTLGSRSGRALFGLGSAPTRGRWALPPSGREGGRRGLGPFPGRAPTPAGEGGDDPIAAGPSGRNAGYDPFKPPAPSPGAAGRRAALRLGELVPSRGERRAGPPGRAEGRGAAGGAAPGGLRGGGGVGGCRATCADTFPAAAGEMVSGGGGPGLAEPPRPAAPRNVCCAVRLPGFGYSARRGGRGPRLIGHLFTSATTPPPPPTFARPRRGTRRPRAGRNGKGVSVPPRLSPWPAGLPAPVGPGPSVKMLTIWS